MSDALRLRLIDRIIRLPDARLAEVERLLSENAISPGAINEQAPRDWPHAPLHRLSEQGTYMVTAATLEQQHHFRGGERLGRTAGFVNGLDAAAGRQVCFNYWDTELTFEKSYLARLNYVHQNAVKHGLVPVANQYRWCSAGWFERTASPAQVRTIYRFKTDRLKVEDGFQPV